MKLDELFAMAGDHQLASMGWGASAIALANAMLADDQKITLTCTGKEAHAKIRALPFQRLVQVLTQDIQLVGTEVSFTATPGNPIAGTPVTVPTASPKMNPMAMLLVILMAVIALGLTFSSMQAAKQSGTVPESETIQVILKTMTEFVKTEQSKQTAPADGS